MKKFLILFFLMTGGAVAATLTAQYVPVVQKGGSTPQLINGSMVDTATTSGPGYVGIGTTNPGGNLDVEGTMCLGHVCESAWPSGTGANPSGTIGLTVVNGSSTNFMRSDAAPAISQAISPTWTATHTFNGSPAIVTGGNIGIYVSAANTTATLTNAGNTSTTSIQTPNANGGITAQNSICLDSQAGAGCSEYLANNGNVGIGTINPGVALDVKGLIRALGTTGINWTGSEITGKGVNWTDIRVYATSFGGDHSGINWQSLGV